MTATAAPDPFEGLDELAAESWPEIITLPGLLPTAPEMPAKIIPGPIRDHVSDIADRLQVAMEIPAVTTVVALSAVVGRSVGIQPKQYDTWLVIPNLWGLVAARSGTLKTPAIEEALKPLAALEAEFRKQFEAEAAARKAEAEIGEARLAALKGEIAKAAKARDEVRLRALKDELIELQRTIDTQAITEQRYRINDATTEKLQEILAANPRGLLVYRDELAGWLRSLDKQGREMDRAFYLEAWNGNQPYTVDRITRGTIHIPALCLSIFGGVQPGRLGAYVQDALDGTSNDDGLIQRFQLAVYPEPRKTWTLVDRPPDKSARDCVQRIFGILNGLDAAALGGLPAHNGVPVLHFDVEAQELFNAWLTAHQRRLLQGEGSEAFVSHLAKYRSLMPSLALLFQLVEWANSQVGPWRTRLEAVSVDATRLAAAWVEYLELHARRIYAGTLNPDLQAAHLILQKIDEAKIKDGTSIRDIYRNQWSALRNKEKVLQGLLVLQEHGYLRLVTVRGDEGRPGSDIVNLNPRRQRDGV